MRRVLILLAVGVAGCGGDDESARRTAEPARAVELRPFPLESEAVGRRLDGRALVPPGGAAGRPMIVLLHGQGMSPELMVTDALRDGLERAGERAPLVLLPDGGDRSYWHDRERGDWARMVLDEAIPAAVQRFGADGERVAIAGLSMGGFGALHLAERRPRRFCSVSAHSPAIFPRNPPRGSPFAGAFDDAADFERHDLIERARRIPPGAWVDIGDRDPFTPAVREMVDRMREPRFRLWRGGHDFTFWNERISEWLRFHLGRC
ncbi:MAG TPA: alpha/beta fold hydrolase [Solirubrobacteraceae bacterium]|nr:alpha/beta fold hydrolase [Solirubrobacteraceae bacterium]